MSFVYPAFLWALIAVSIPVIIHLFNFRSYKTVYFSNLAFLSSVRKERKNRSRLKHLLVLLARIIAIAAIIIAFAQPYLPQADQVAQKKTQEQYVTIYIDNSFSMNAGSEQGNLLNRAKNRATQIAEGYKSNTKFYLVTNDFNPAYQHWASRGQFTEMVQEVETSPVSRELSKIAHRQKDHIQNTAIGSRKFKHTAYWISDFQKSTTDLGAIKPDSLTQVQLLALRAQKVRNLYIDTAWYPTPSRKRYQEENLNVSIKNAGDEAYRNMSLKLYINDTLRAMNTFDIEAGGETNTTLNYSNQNKGDMLARLEITDYPITYDNRLYFNYRLSRQMDVAFVSDSTNRFVRRLFEDKLMNFQHIKPGELKPNELNVYETIILNEIKDLASGLKIKLLEYISQGGTLALIPSTEKNPASMNNLLRSISGAPVYEQMQEEEMQLKSINFNHKLYNQAFEKQEEELNLPGVKRYYTLGLNARSKATDLLSLQNSEPVLLHLPHKEGELYVFGINMEPSTTDLVTHPLIVPTLYNMALYSLKQRRLYHIIGGSNQINIDARPDEGDVLHIKSMQDNTDFIPQQISNSQRSSIRLIFRNQIPKAGYYTVSAKKAPLRYLSFNYNRKESDLTYYNKTQLEEMANRYSLKHMQVLEGTPEYINSKVAEMSNANHLWRLFLLIALIALALEAVFIRILN